MAIHGCHQMGVVDLDPRYAKLNDQLTPLSIDRLTFGQGRKKTFQTAQKPFGSFNGISQAIHRNWSGSNIPELDEILWGDSQDFIPLSQNSDSSPNDGIHALRTSYKSQEYVCVDQPRHVTGDPHKSLRG